MSVGAVTVAAVVAGAAGYQLGRVEGEEARPATVVAAKGEDAAPVAADAASQGASGPSFDEGAAPVGEEVTPVAARTTASGLVIRAIEVGWSHTPDEFAPGWVPPPVCRPAGNLEIGLVAEQYVGMGWAQLFEGVPGAFAVWGSGATGHTSLGPLLFAAVRTTDAVRAVRLLQDGAVVDEVLPENGWAIVAAQGPATSSPASPVPAGAEVEIEGDGGVLERRPLGQVDLPYDLPECQPPPPSLPPEVRPAGEADAESVAGIEAAYRGVFEPPPDDLREHLAGSDQIDDGLLGRVAEQAASYGVQELTVQFHDIGFLDDGTAVVVFDLLGAPLSAMYGEAVRVDGTWKVSAQTWCSLISLMGVSCPSGLWDPNQGTSRFQVTG